MSTDQERAAFEAWAVKRVGGINLAYSDGYDVFETSLMWSAWQAATARQASEIEALRLKLDTAYAVVIDLGGEVREPELEEQRRLRADAARYRWLRDNTDSDWAICEWNTDESDGIGYYRDARAPNIVDAAIDAAKEQQA